MSEPRTIAPQPGAVLDIDAEKAFAKADFEDGEIESPEIVDGRPLGI